MRRQAFEQGQFPGLETPQRPPRPRMTKEVFNPYTAAHSALQSETVRRVTTARTFGQSLAPAGMRGSIPERLALSHRLDRKRQGEARWETLRERMRDEDIGGDYMDEEPEPHPVTGLPAWGAIRTYKANPNRQTAWERENADAEPNIGFEYGSVPHEVSFHGSTASARRRAGTAKWIPVPGIRTGQETVSAGRVHQAMESPETTSNPRVPFRELPHVYEESHPTNPGERIYTMIDGNHRMSANILQGKLFAEANVLTSRDKYRVQDITRRVSHLKDRAARKTDPDFVESRMNRNVYGDEY